MVIRKEELKTMFLSVAEIWKENSAYLNEIDSKFGDGDHGITIQKIALLIEKEVDQWEQESMFDFIDGLGTEIMGVNGGSAGPLYGTLIGGLAIPLDGVEEINGDILKEMLEGSVSELQDITKAKVGDKTMMDALIPAVEAASGASEEIADILDKAKEAAVRGSKESEKFVSKYGRARSYKEQTIGTPDAGAVSTSLFFVGLARLFEKV